MTRALAILLFLCAVSAFSGQFTLIANHSSSYFAGMSCNNSPSINSHCEWQPLYSRYNVVLNNVPTQINPFPSNLPAGRIINLTNTNISSFGFSSNRPDYVSPSAAIAPSFTFSDSKTVDGGGDVYFYVTVCSPSIATAAYGDFNLHTTCIFSFDIQNLDCSGSDSGNEFLCPPPSAIDSTNRFCSPSESRAYQLVEFEKNVCAQNGGRWEGSPTPSPIGGEYCVSAGCNVCESEQWQNEYLSTHQPLLDECCSSRGIEPAIPPNSCTNGILQSGFGVSKNPSFPGLTYQDLCIGGPAGSGNNYCNIAPPEIIEDCDNSLDPLLCQCEHFGQCSNNSSASNSSGSGSDASSDSGHLTDCNDNANHDHPDCVCQRDPQSCASDGSSGSGSEGGDSSNSGGNASSGSGGDGGSSSASDGGGSHSSDSSGGGEGGESSGSGSGGSSPSDGGDSSSVVSCKNFANGCDWSNLVTQLKQLGIEEGISDRMDSLLALLKFNANYGRDIDARLLGKLDSLRLDLSGSLNGVSDSLSSAIGALGGVLGALSDSLAKAISGLGDSLSDGNSPGGSLCYSSFASAENARRTYSRACESCSGFDAYGVNSESYPGWHCVVGGCHGCANYAGGSGEGDGSGSDSLGSGEGGEGDGCEGVLGFLKGIFTSDCGGEGGSCEGDGCLGEGNAGIADTSGLGAKAGGLISGGGRTAAIYTNEQIGNLIPIPRSGQCPVVSGSVGVGSKKKAVSFDFNNLVPGSPVNVILFIKSLLLLTVYFLNVFTMLRIFQSGGRK